MNNNYMYPGFYNNQQYEKDLQNIMRDAQNKLNQLHSQQQPQQPQQQVPITQNFQLSPTQNLSGIKYAIDIEDVKRQTVFGDTLFINKDYTQLWLKKATGDVKTYEVREIIEKDEKDLKIDELTAKIDRLERELKENEQSNNTDVSKSDENIKSKGTNSKSSRK